eukprot:5413948-Amphidinium_carterae.1
MFDCKFTERKGTYRQDCKCERPKHLSAGLSNSKTLPSVAAKSICIDSSKTAASFYNNHSSPVQDKNLEAPDP